MEFVESFVEVLCMIAILFGLFVGLFYFLRHRAKFARWVDNYGSKENVVEKDARIRALRRKIEDAEADITELESASQEEK